MVYITLMINRIFLSAVAAMFFAFGYWSITAPLMMTSQLGVVVSGPAAAFEMRGVYGGISLGAALLCLGGAIHRTLQRPALYFIATYMGGYVIGRAASLVAGDTAPTNSWIFAGFELVIFLCAATILQRRRK
ncbi:MAG: DUF4345 family protein [Henriciella sp.]